MSRPPITRARPYTPKRGLVAGQTFHSERQYRNALAKALGFASHYQRERYPHVVTSAREEARLRPSAKKARKLAFQVLAEARRTGQPISRVARDYRVSMASIKRYAGPALEKRGGVWFAKPQDRLYRSLMTITKEGVTRLDTTSSKTASLIGRYNHAVREYFRTGNEDVLRPFRGRSFQVGKRRYRFETDPKRLKALQESGALDDLEWGSP